MALIFKFQELENEIDMYRQKNQIYRDEFNLDFKISKGNLVKQRVFLKIANEVFFKENKNVKIIFLNNDQEILLTFLDDQTVKSMIISFNKYFF